MKKLFAIVIVLGLMSCSKENKLISDMKSEFKKYELPNFNDPKSFEEVEAKIVDTTFEKNADSLFIESFYDGVEKYKAEMDLYKEFYEKEGKVSYLKDLAESNKQSYLTYKEKYENSVREKDSALKVNSKIPTDKIRSVNLNYRIRAKNAMGALILNDIDVSYYPKVKHFFFKMNEKK